MEWIWVALLALILFGPIVFVLIRGRNAAPPSVEDRHGYTAYNELIRRKLTDGKE